MIDRGTCVLGTVLVVGQSPTRERSSGLTCLAAEVICVDTEALGGQLLAGQQPDLIVILEQAGGEEVPDALRACRSYFPDVPSVVVTWAHNAETARMLEGEGGWSESHERGPAHRPSLTFPRNEATSTNSADPGVRDPWSKNVLSPCR